MTRVYAHRGARLELPENTIPAFARALDVGADAIELDCHMTKDGVIVVSHDETGARMANVPQAIAQSSFAEVRDWNVSAGFVAAEFAESEFERAKMGGDRFRIPSLEEVLSTFPGVRLNVDAKQESPDMIPALLRMIRRVRAENYVQLASFSSKNLGKIRDFKYEGSTSLGPREIAAARFLPRSFLNVLPLAGNAAQIPRAQGPVRLDSARFIAKCHALGIRVDYWVVNDAEEARMLVSRGADGIVTDDPRLIVRTLRSESRD